MDKLAAANKINEFLRAVITHGGLRIKYRITVDPVLPENRDWERPEIVVDLAGPESPLLLTGEDLLKILGGLPEGREECAHRAITALQNALGNYSKGATTDEQQ